MTGEPGLDRRGALKTLLVLGGAASLTGACAGGAGRRADVRQLAGQRVIYSYSGLTVPSALLQQISAGQAAGVIFFGENISSEAQIASVIRQLRQAQRQSPVSSPLLLMTDQEGGLVRRLPGAPAHVGRSRSARPPTPAAAAAAGTGAGQNLAGVGMNVNLAPVLDVYYKSGNFIDQFQRSYSSDPPRWRVRAGRSSPPSSATGVAATAKHFPGLGAATASQNTDLRPGHPERVAVRRCAPSTRRPTRRPSPPASSSSWRPGRSTRRWTPRRPAGLSPAVVQGELRGRLGYQRRDHHRRDRGGRAGGFGSIGQRGRARRPGRDGPAALLGPEPGAGAGGGHGPGRRPGQGS